MSGLHRDNEAVDIALVFCATKKSFNTIGSLGALPLQTCSSIAVIVIKLFCNLYRMKNISPVKKQLIN